MHDYDTSMTGALPVVERFALFCQTSRLSVVPGSTWGCNDQREATTVWVSHQAVQYGEPRCDGVVQLQPSSLVSFPMTGLGTTISGPGMLTAGFMYDKCGNTS